ncbi:MAG: VOC family protein [Pikeienuella sp.]
MEIDAELLPPQGEGRPDPAAFGRSIPPGLGINLLVRDVEAAARWQARVLGARVIYWDRDFALLQAQDAVWMLHHDRTYAKHPLGTAVAGEAVRGAGAELRLYGADPDRAEAAAERFGGTVLARAADKPHGVREAFLLDPEGYCWAPTKGLG